MAQLATELKVAPSRARPRREAPDAILEAPLVLSMRPPATMTEDQFIARLRLEGRHVRPALRRAACPQHVHDERDDQEEGKQA